MPGDEIEIVERGVRAAGLSNPLKRLLVLVSKPEVDVERDVARDGVER